MAHGQKRAGIDRRVHFCASCDRAIGSGVLPSSRQRRQFGELGFLHEIAHASRCAGRRKGGVYLGEYGSARVNSVLRFIADVLNGVPSITWGVVVYGLIVLRFKGFSAYAGGLALGLIMIPLIIRTTEEVVLLVPNGYREAALALGVSRWKTIVHVVMKTASKGIITGILLALARVGGETAPLLFTAFGNRFWNHSLSQPIAALPLQIFTYAISPYDDWHRQAWAGALVLVTGIFCVNVLVRILTRGRTASTV